MQKHASHRASPRFAAAALAGVLLLAVLPGSVGASAGASSALIDDDIIDAGVYPGDDLPGGFETLGADPSDPLGLIPYPGETQRYSLGRDVFEVWECPSAGDVPVTAAQFVQDAETEMTTYFTWQSEGRYDPDFVVGGAVPDGEDCGDWAQANSIGGANGVLFIRQGTGGYAGPGYTCAGFSSSCPTTYPSNRREGYVGVSGSSTWTTVAHEMGHMLAWPHSTTGISGSQYDNAIDVMSGNYNTWKVGARTHWGTYYEPYATTAINRYGAGWFDPQDVVVWNGASANVTLETIGSGSNQLFVIEQQDSYFVLAARVSSSLDPFANAWSGVEVYEVGRCSGCWGLNAEVTPQPPVPFSHSDLASYSTRLPHVMQPGQSMTLGDASVSVVSHSGNSYTLSVASTSPGPPTRFTDVPSGHTFHSDIEWLADVGVTKGCNPPANTLYCPDGAVTRGQMAAFLVRALDLETAEKDFFSDDEQSVFEDDINRLAAAGITKGCNPPSNDRFCPETKLTRGQMAALLVRAFGFTDVGEGNLFIDDDASIFEVDIDRLGSSGVTKGCNPPENDRFCPGDTVTRAQVAAFLHRANS